MLWLIKIEKERGRVVGPGSKVKQTMLLLSADCTLAINVENIRSVRLRLSWDCPYGNAMLCSRRKGCRDSRQEPQWEV